MARTTIRKKKQVRYEPMVELPPLSPEEYEGLRSSILVSGVLLPIMVDSDGPRRRIIDGNYRKQIADELDYSCPEVVVANIPDDELRVMSRAINLSRRQLDTSQKRQIIADQLKETPERTARWIGKMLGVDGKTVTSVRIELETGADFPHLTKLLAPDGKYYPTYWTHTQHSYPEDNQNYQTPISAIKPLLKYLPEKWTIWEPCCGGGNISGFLQEQGRKVIATDIQTGHDFLNWKPRRHFDAIITNPPHRHATAFMRRCYELGKPFALLLPLLHLEGRERHSLYRKHGLQLMFFDKRVAYESEKDGTRRDDVPFSSVWFCWQLLGRNVVFTELAEE